MIDDFSSEFISGSGGVRRLDDDLLQFDNEVINQPSVDIFMSDEDFMAMSGDG